MTGGRGGCRRGNEGVGSCVEVSTKRWKRQSRKRVEVYVAMSLPNV